MVHKAQVKYKIKKILKKVLTSKKVCAILYYDRCSTADVATTNVTTTDVTTSVVPTTIEVKEVGSDEHRYQ